MAFRRSSRVSPSVSDADRSVKPRPDASKEPYGDHMPPRYGDVATLLTINTEGMRANRWAACRRRSCRDRAVTALRDAYSVRRNVAMKKIKSTHVSSWAVARWPGYWPWPDGDRRSPMPSPRSPRPPMRRARGRSSRTGTTTLPSHRSPVAAAQGWNADLRPDHATRADGVRGGEPVNTLGIQWPVPRANAARIAGRRIGVTVTNSDRASRRRSTGTACTCGGDGRRSHTKTSPTAVPGNRPGLSTRRRPRSSIIRTRWAARAIRSRAARWGIPPRRRQPRADRAGRTSTAWTTSHSSCRSTPSTTGNLGRVAEEVGAAEAATGGILVMVR